VIRFRFDPDPDEGFDFEHFRLEGNNASGYVLLGYHDGQAPAAERAPEFEGEENFDEELQEELFQRWFETLGEALGVAEDELGIPRSMWAAPIISTQSGRLVPPMPQTPPARANPENIDNRPAPRIGRASAE